MKSPRKVRRTFSHPRKIVVGGAVHALWQNYPGLEPRLAEMGRLVDDMARKAAERWGGARLDLAILPEFAITGARRVPFSKAAIRLDGKVLGPMGAKARQHSCYLVVPLHLLEEGWRIRYFNAAALLDRQGKLAGIYRYVHPSAWELSEGDIAPGQDFPVFDCDFGRLGIQICGDAAYADGWRELKRQGAELVALPSQPPYSFQLALRAAANRLYVLSSTWRGEAALYDPLGVAVAKASRDDPVLVEQIDLSYVLLGWQESLAGGKVFEDAYGADRVGGRYYESDDRGIFWSNDPETPITKMVRQLKLQALELEHKQSIRAQHRARGGPPR